MKWGLKQVRPAEWAVILAVWAVCAVIVLPAFQRSRCYMSPCPVNQKYLALAMLHYARDHDNRLVPAGGGHTLHSNTLSGWPVLLAPELPSTSRRWSCPGESFQRGGTDYWLNGNTSSRSLDELHFPARTVLVTEGRERRQGRLAIAWKPQRQTVGQGKPPFARHREGSYYCFVDGHVKWLHSSMAPGDWSVAANASTFTFGR